MVEYLMILYLWDRLPEDLLQLFWELAPERERRHAMWFVGRHMVSTNDLRARAMSYWDRRLQYAVRAGDPEPYRKELSIISTLFLWDIDPLWLMNQLLIVLNADLGPTDAMGVIDKLVDQVPEHVNTVVEIVSTLVKLPRVQAWDICIRRSIPSNDFIGRKELPVATDQSFSQGNRQLSFVTRKLELSRY